MQLLAVENLSVEAEVEEEADIAECQMVDITKDAEHVEETALEPQFDEKLKTAYQIMVMLNIYILMRRMETYNYEDDEISDALLVVMMRMMMICLP